MTLPPLPAAAYVDKKHHDPVYDDIYFTEAQMREYGQQCREAALAALTKDAERYQFIKTAKALTLRSDGSTWTRDTVPFVATHSMSAYGTSYGAYPSLDELVDTAMKEQS